MSTDSTERLTGRVKWFNNKTGYGFITVTDGSSAGTDVFVHHSSIGVSDEQYKYLVQGEYVEFSLVSVPSGAHSHQASSVSGIKGGKLMCETRHETRVFRSKFRVENETPVTSDSKPKVVNKVERTDATGGRGGARQTRGRGGGHGRGRGSSTK